MIISYQWLLEYLPQPLPIDELGKILTSIGLEVEAIEPSEAIKGSLEGLVIGEVLTADKHPNADKLKVTTVNVGADEPLQIVCGAPNVAAGQKVVVATVGTTVHPTTGEPFLIKKAKIRGEESAGMICAEDEIGLGKDHGGIMVLDEHAIVGTLAKTYFNIPSADFAIHIGLTPNRSDANSHIGVARDVCAYLTHHGDKKYEVRLPDVQIAETKGNNIKINIEATEACARYAGISLANIKVGASPEWLQQRLNTVGMRSINNVVDITNYVLHEYGQPLHAFDEKNIKGSEINVRFVAEGTKFITLDEKERKLNAEDLMICDSAEPVAMAGVFGGLHSGVNDSTTNIFIESAYFDPKTIRRTSMRHGLRTDAATHFEKGVDINNVLPAMKRAASLMVEIAGASVASQVTDNYPKPVQENVVTVSYDYIQKLSGKAYSTIAIKEVLTALGFETITETNDTLTLKVPTNKADVSQPADIVEEIVRIDGLDNVQIPNRLNISLTKAMPDDRQLRNKVASLLCGMGMQEIVTNSIVNSKFYPERTYLVRMINSLSTELDVMRPSMAEGGLEVVAYNCNRKSQDLALFEFGNIYAVVSGKYVQQPQLAIWITGNIQIAHWDQKPVKANIFQMKGVINNLLEYNGINTTSLSYNENETVWKWKNQVLCTAKQLTTKRLGEFDIKQEVFFAEINWDVWVKATTAKKIKFNEVAKFPAVQRDLAVIIDTGISYEAVQNATEQLKLDALKDFDLFDVFESEKLGQGKKSYALSYTFQLQDRTLTDAEIEQMMKQLMDTYKNKLQAQIRE